MTPLGGMGFDPNFYENLDQSFKNMEGRLFRKLASVVVGSVTVAFLALTWLFDYRFDFISQEVSEVRQEVYTPSKDILLKEIREIKEELAGFHTRLEDRKKTVLKGNIKNIKKQKK